MYWETQIFKKLYFKYNYLKLCNKCQDDSIIRLSLLGVLHKPAQVPRSWLERTVHFWISSLQTSIQFYTCKIDNNEMTNLSQGLINFSNEAKIKQYLILAMTPKTNEYSN